MKDNKLEFIQDVKDSKGHIHSVLIYKINGKRAFKYGNLIYSTMKEVKTVISSI